MANISPLLVMGMFLLLRPLPVLFERIMSIKVKSIPLHDF